MSIAPEYGARGTPNFRNKRPIAEVVRNCTGQSTAGWLRSYELDLQVFEARRSSVIIAAASITSTDQNVLLLSVCFHESGVSGVGWLSSVTG